MQRRSTTCCWTLWRRGWWPGPGQCPPAWSCRTPAPAPPTVPGGTTWRERGSATSSPGEDVPAMITTSPPASSASPPASPAPPAASGPRPGPAGTGSPDTTSTARSASCERWWVETDSNLSSAGSSTAAVPGTGTTSSQRRSAGGAAGAVRTTSLLIRFNIKYSM